MIAAIRDNPDYLVGTEDAHLLTEDVRETIGKIGAVIADHPDPMLDPKQNPDILHWNVTRMPVMVITGSKEHATSLNLKLFTTLMILSHMT